ncbi:MAG: tetrahydrofolate dehydrogenase/cyclohydrolase catalytic domain-containing protein [Phycisphaerae bacterium]
MSAKLIDGKALAREINSRTQEQVAALVAARGAQPTVAAVLIGDDASAAAYAQSQARGAASVGIAHRIVQLPAGAAPAHAEAAIDRLNDDPAVHGIILQTPLPSGLDPFALQAQIDPRKDVEGVSPANLGLVWMARPALAPCTAEAALACALASGLDLAGRHAVVVGRSNIVGKPVAALLLARHATVTICHSRTPDLPALTRQAELLIVAIGRAGAIGAAHVRPGAVVVDVGTNTLPGPDGRSRMVGDVAFDQAQAVAGWITPVPGGVGPVTVAKLLANVATSAERQVLR